MSARSVFDRLTWRLTLGTALVFALGALLALWLARHALANALDAEIDADIAALVETFATGGEGGLTDAVERRLALTPSDRARPIYGLRNGSGDWVIGNVSPEQLAEVPQVRPAELVVDGTRFRVRSTALRGNATLLVGRATDRMDALLLRLGLIFALALGAASALAALIAKRLGRDLRDRVRHINTVLERVGAGHTTERIGRDQPPDEISHLAEQTDATFDQLEHLLRLRQRVSDQVAHEIRSPLTRLDQILQRAQLDPSSANIAEGRAALERTLDLLDHLLDVSALDAQRGDKRGFAPVDLGGLVRDLGGLFDAVAEDAGMRLRIVAPERGPVVQGDAAQLGRLVSNLIDNAVKYGDPETPVTLTLTEEARLSVANSGPAIPDEAAEDIFVPFMRVARASGDDRANGHGLGLALCRAIAARHDGSLHLEPRARSDDRTVFVLQLPVKSAVAPQAGLEPATQ